MSGDSAFAVDRAAMPATATVSLRTMGSASAPSAARIRTERSRHCDRRDCLTVQTMMSGMRSRLASTARCAPPRSGPVAGPVTRRRPHRGSCRRGAGDCGCLRRADRRPAPRERRDVHARAEEQDVPAARAGGSAGIDRRVPEQRRHLSQRVLAVRPAAVRPRTVSRRRIAPAHVHRAGHLSRVLQHPSADDGDHRRRADARSRRIGRDRTDGSRSTCRRAATA